jgi:hypothetical protein
VLEPWRHPWRSRRRCNGPSVASLPSRRPPAERDTGGGAWRLQCPPTGMKADERGGGRGVHRRIHLRGRGQGVHRREVQGTRCRLASAREIQPWRMTGLGAVDSLHGPPAVDSGINSSNTTMRPLLHSHEHHLILRADLRVAMCSLMHGVMLSTVCVCDNCNFTVHHSR